MRISKGFPEDFISNGKKWKESKIAERQRERERVCKRQSIASRER
jgi:hypothetical protein